jgi:hypothetical protein
MGHGESVEHLPWPSDVTPEMIATWRAEYLASQGEKRIELGESFTIPDGACLLDASTYEGRRYVVVEQDVGSVQPVPTQMDRIESLLVTLVEALADEGEEMDQPELTLDGEAVGGERDDSQPL